MILIKISFFGGGKGNMITIKPNSFETGILEAMARKEMKITSPEGEFPLLGIKPFIKHYNNLVRFWF